MATTIRQELDEEFLYAIRQGQEMALEALRHLVEAVHYVIPTMPVVRVPLASRLPTAHEVVADRYEFAEHLLANQRKFADEVIAATSPMLPGRAGPKRITAKAA
jgi:hypothetical protein